MALAIAACGGGDNPVEVRLEEETADQTVLGFPALATKNTTRVGGEDAAADAAGTATATYPGQTRGTRPRAVTLVDQDDWRAGIAAAALMGPPLRAPVLLTDGADLPRAHLHRARHAEAHGRTRRGRRAGDRDRRPARAPGDLRARRIAGGDPVRLAAAIDAFATDVARPPVARTS